MLFKKYREKRRARRETQAYIRGFEWAMSEMFIARQPPSYVHAYCFNNHNAFDRGARYALRVAASIPQN